MPFNNYQVTPSLEQTNSLAPLISELPPAEQQLISELDLGVQNFLVKCINSSFTDKFVYLPTHQHGLIIGGK